LVPIFSIAVFRCGCRCADVPGIQTRSPTSMSPLTTMHCRRIAEFLSISCRCEIILWQVPTAYPFYDGVCGITRRYRKCLWIPYPFRSIRLLRWLSSCSPRTKPHRIRLHLHPYPHLTSEAIDSPRRNPPPFRPSFPSHRKCRRFQQYRSRSSFLSSAVVSETAVSVLSYTTVAFQFHLIPFDV
jgi:hypothetical protein